MSTSFSCSCKQEKTHRLTFDGGSEGNYDLELCLKCHKIQDKQFLVNEELISKFDSDFDAMTNYE